MSFVAVAAGTAGAAALGKGLTSYFQGRKANKIAKNNILPIQQVQGEYFKNVAESEQMARIGMPQEQYNNALNNINRNQAGVLRRFGGSNQSLASILRASNDNTMGLDVKDANDRMRNRLNLFQQRGILAGQKNNAFDWNKKQPYIANLAKEQALRGASAQNLNGAFNDLTTAATSLAMGSNGYKAG